jgi:hypothetical protein
MQCVFAPIVRAPRRRVFDFRFLHRTPRLTPSTIDAADHPPVAALPPRALAALARLPMRDDRAACGCG